MKAPLWPEAELQTTRQNDFILFFGWEARLFSSQRSLQGAKIWKFNRKREMNTRTEFVVVSDVLCELPCSACANHLALDVNFLRKMGFTRNVFFFSFSFFGNTLILEC